MNDKRNPPPPAGLAPLVLFFLILGIGVSLGMDTTCVVCAFSDILSDMV